MKRFTTVLFLMSICLQPLYSETLTDENGYVNQKLEKRTYFAGASSTAEENIVRKPASIQKAPFYKRYLESKEDKFSYIFMK